MEIRIPTLAEGIESGAVISILVSEGDTVEKDQDLLEIETEKATAAIPSTGAGKVTKIHVAEGDTVKVGQAVITLDGDDAPAEKTPQASEPVSEKGTSVDVRVPALAEGIESGAVISILVSEGDTVEVDQDLLELETEKATAALPSTAAGKVLKVLVKEGETVKVGQRVVTIQSSQPSAIPQPVDQPTAQSAPTPTAQPVSESTTAFIKANEKLVEAGLSMPASPSAKRMARQLGIDLRRVSSSHRGGRISLDDLKAYVAGLQQGKAQESPTAKPTVKQTPLPDFSKWGSIRTEKMTMLRKKISEKMTESWTTIPHVTQYDKAKISALMKMAKKHAPAYEKNGARLTLTVLILRAVIAVLKKYPQFNASIDVANEQIIYKDYVNLGIAVDTEQGLIVPVIHNADQKSPLDLAKSLADLAARTRDRKVSLEELQGGTFTISNQGGIGGGAFTPIINSPEVAILGLARGVKKPVVIKDKVSVEMVLPLSLSYDHRLIDGGNAARFITELVNELENFDDKQLKI